MSPRAPNRAKSTEMDPWRTSGVSTRDRRDESANHHPYDPASQIAILCPKQGAAWPLMISNVAHAMRWSSAEERHRRSRRRKRPPRIETTQTDPWESLHWIPESSRAALTTAYRGRNIPRSIVCGNEKPAPQLPFCDSGPSHQDDPPLGPHAAIEKQQTEGHGWPSALAGRMPVIEIE